MKLTPRTNEVKAIVELLESDEFESANDLAKAILKRVADILSERDFYAWVYRENEEAWYLPYGPFTSDNEAKKYAARYIMALKGQHMILKLNSTAALDERMAQYKVPSKFCANPECGHSLIGHEHPKIQPKCAVKRCKCRRAVTE